MSFSSNEQTRVRAEGVVVTDDRITVQLSDGRTLSASLTGYPRLERGTPAERANWSLIGQGQGIHWPDLDEDISVEGLLEGRSSMESPSSFKRWVAARGRG